MRQRGEASSQMQLSHRRDKIRPERHIQADEQHLQLCHRQSRHCAPRPILVQRNTENYNSDEVEAVARRVVSEYPPIHFYHFIDKRNQEAANSNNRAVCGC